ncbi:MAG: YggS family pyridoxal phosphate-dependent enzyme [Fimbriimonadales bacterium]
MSFSHQLSKRIEEVKQRIAAAAATAKRDADDITLIGVTKTVPIEHVADAYRLGMRDFGENYFQEATPKITEMPGAVWHFVGRIQSNKAANIGSMFSVVHTVDSLDKAAKLVKRASQPISVLLEVNIGREPQKAGVFPEKLDELFESVYHMPSLRVRGLMTMGPANRKAEELRPYFAEMRSLLERLGLQEGGWLSMGMSADYEVAIQEGATHVRIGSAIFGQRTT